jgi:PAS domain S-box-containing protein
MVGLSVERAFARRTAKREQEHLRQYTEELRRTLNEGLLLSSIREQEHAEAEAQQRAQLNALLENLSEGVLIVDPSGVLFMVNAAARAIMGLRAEDCAITVEAIHSLEAYHLDGRPLRSEERPLMRALRGEQFVDYEIVRQRPDGEKRRLASTGTSVRDVRGDIALALVIFRDVTELRQLEQQRDEYLSLVSHDLRNPLNSILMIVSSLKRSMEKKGLLGEMSLAQRAERNVKRMNAMIEELAEAATLESDCVAPKRDVCDLRELAGSVVDRMDDARARRVTIDADDASPYVVLGDASRLERVVANLLTNALKYSAEDAPVNVHLGRSGGAVVLDVIDRGIGIEPENVKRLFDRYYRTTMGEAQASGSGLGLYITRMIVEAHHGRIEVTSEVGKGSRFRLTLPSHGAAA